MADRDTGPAGHDRRALIVGAGIGGLAAGIALRAGGWDVRIFERAPAPRAEGFALSVAPNAVLALEELGVGPRVAAAACPVAGVEVRDERGETLKRIDVTAAVGQARSLFILREALHGTLLAALGDTHVTFGAEVTGISPGVGGVQLTMADGRTASGEVLIGADGVGSVVRKWLHPAEGPPRDSGFIAFRGLARGAVPHLRGLSIVGYMGGGAEAATIQAAEDAVYWYVSTRVGDGPQADAPAEELLAYCARLFDEPFRRVIERTATSEVRADVLFDRDPGGPWGRGRVTLLGDASQPVLPHTGQGAALALEDAVALKLALQRGDTEARLRQYEQVRAAKKKPLVTRGRRVAAFTAAKGPAASWARRSLIRLLPAKAAIAAYLMARRRDPHEGIR